jgi:hypothetical protein
VSTANEGDVVLLTRQCYRRDGSGLRAVLADGVRTYRGTLAVNAALVLGTVVLNVVETAAQH